MGESKLKQTKQEESLMTCAGVQTVAGRIQIRWESKSAATPMGQLAYFIEFLTLTGLWLRWLTSCPLTYLSHNAPSKADVLGTGMLSVLSGHKRYSHVTAMRCDGVNPGLLEMNKVISEDSMRGALKHIRCAEGTAWLDQHISDSTAPLLDAPWIMDTDTTVKPLYGKQEGAVISYNPTKPGRPSHTYHTYIMAGLRLVLGVEVHAGNEHAAKHTQPRLLKMLDDLPETRKPKWVRGDSAFGNDPLMTAPEERQQPYLFKLKLTKNVKRHITRLFRESGWSDAGQGWDGHDGTLTLMGWTQARRAGKEITGYEYAVLVTNTDYEILSLGQLYRDRADAENVFDELKNQWGWGGFTTHDLHRCQLAARAVALIYNWWSLYVRLANPQARREAITSRPWLMSSVGCRTEHAGQTTITLTGLHADFAKARAALMRVSALLQEWVVRATEQLNPTTVWLLVCDHLKRVIASIGPPQNIRLLTNLANGVG